MLVIVVRYSYLCKSGTVAIVLLLLLGAVGYRQAVASQGSCKSSYILVGVCVKVKKVKTSICIAHNMYTHL